jgi:ketosteroid isomerase-like protein
MKQLLAGFLVLLFCVSPVRPQKASQPTSQAGIDAASAELVTLTIAWTEAINAKDHAKLEALMAPEFAVYGWSGELWAPRSQWLDNLFNHIKIKENTVREVSPRVYGDFAIVTSVGTWAGASDGHSFDLRTIVVDTWRKTNGQWQVVTRTSCRRRSTSASSCGR